MRHHLVEQNRGPKRKTSKLIPVTKYVQFLEVSGTNDSTMFWPLQAPLPLEGDKMEK